MRNESMKSSRSHYMAEELTSPALEKKDDSNKKVPQPAAESKCCCTIF